MKHEITLPALQGDWEYASLNRRLNSTAIDALLFFIVLMPMSQLLYSVLGIAEALVYFTFEASLGMHPHVGDFFRYLQERGLLIRYCMVQVIGLAIFTFSVILFWWRKGATPGGMITRCRVVDADTGAPLSFKQAVKRAFSCALSLLPLTIGILMIGFTKRKQALHDKIANTLVLTKVQQSPWGYKKKDASQAKLAFLTRMQKSVHKKQ